MVRGFVVDTHLLRELGDLLVGRDSTAVLELVKNGYDADATVVRIHARDLGDPAQAVLVVEDNGNGMTLTRFEDAFLRIAGRHKETGGRRSPRFGRSYTGQKGIGRLASQKLANRLEVLSRPNRYVSRESDRAVHATIDWDEIDRQDRLDDLSSGLDVAGIPLSASIPSGTTLTLRALKRQWTRAEIANFVNELQTAQPPAYLMGNTRESLALADEPLFDSPRTRVVDDTDRGFVVELAGDLESGDDLWETAADQFSWCVEIDVDNHRARYKITPTVTTARSDPFARSYYFEADIPENVQFRVRFFVMPNASSRGPLAGFRRAQSGIRVYSEGFRVLPYGEYGDDWLEIDREYRSGPRYYSIDLDLRSSDSLEVDRKEGLSALANSAYYGAVFLTTDGAPELQSLVNREGFVPSPTFDAIREVVQKGVRLSVRVRRSVHNQRELLRVRTAASPPPVEVPIPVQEPEVEKPATILPVQETQQRSSFDLFIDRDVPDAKRRAMEAAESSAKNLLAEGVTQVDSLPEVRALVDGFQAAREALQGVQAIQPELRTLAGVGLQLGAFVHDINGMLASARNIRELLQALISESSDRSQRRELQAILRTAEELAHVLARQSSYLTDVLSTDPRRRRSGVSVSDRVESVLRFLSGRILDRKIAVHTSIASGLKSPPMFPAEVTILLTNLLTNAVKNASYGGNVWIDASDLGSREVEIVITNDGNAVDLGMAERWFLPFESTTTDVDEVLGQGLGLGLPIVRAITDDYNGDVRFIEPPHDGATAVRVLLRRKER